MQKLDNTIISRLDNTPQRWLFCGAVSKIKVRKMTSHAAMTSSFHIYLPVPGEVIAYQSGSDQSGIPPSGRPENTHVMAGPGGYAAFVRQ
jgi:hypothetical protein